MTAAPCTTSRIRRQGRAALLAVPCSLSPVPCRSRRGSILLEVLVTVTIMAMFMALIGSQILASVRAAGVIERRQTAMLLSESLVGRLQAGGFELTNQPQQMADTFGDTYPGWGWRVSTDTTDDPALMRVHIEVLQGDPAQPTAGVESMASVADMYTLWALPAQINLAEDFGLSDADTSALAALGIDPNNFDPASLAGLDLPSLLKQFPQLEQLLQMYGIDPSMLATLDPATIQQALQAYLGSGGSIPNLPGLSGGTAGANGGAGSGGYPDGSGSGGGGNTADNNNDNSGGGSFDMGEVVKLLTSGDKAGAEAYVRAHQDELNAGRGGGAGGNPGGAGAGNNSGGRAGGRGR